jgi:predicted enzyme related to lactoylglutathione lyase
MDLIGPIFYSKDLNAAVEFYKKLGLELEELQGKTFAQFKFSNGQKLGIKKAAEEREKPGSQSTMIHVDAIEKVYKKFQSKELMIVYPLAKQAWGTTFIISDPDGNWLEFIE